MEFLNTTGVVEGSVYAEGVGFHALVDALKRKPRRNWDSSLMNLLLQIPDSHLNERQGLIAAGEIVDPASAFTGCYPTWLEVVEF